MPGCVSVLSMEEAHKRPATRAEMIDPLRALSLGAVHRLVAAGYHSALSPYPWQKLPDRRRVMHRSGALSAPRYAQASEAHTMMTQYRERSPLARVGITIH